MSLSNSKILSVLTENTPSKSCNFKLSTLATSISLIGFMSVMAPASYADENIPTATLDTITITASSGGITPTVNHQTVEKSTILDMKDVLKDQPSLSVSGGNGVAQQLYIRNFGENELTFTVDDVPTNSPIFHHQSRFMFDPALLKSLEIQKGTGSASSGIGVTAGAVRMTTVDADDILEKGDNVGAMLGAGYSSNAGSNATVAGYGRSEKMANGSSIDGVVMANQVEMDNYENGRGIEVPYTKMTQQAYLAKLGWNVNDDNRVAISHRREENSGDLALRANFIGSFRNGTIFDTTTTQDTTNLSYEGYDVGTEGVDIDANAYYGKVSDIRHQIANESPKFPSTIDSSIVKQGANISVNYPIGNHELVSGVNYRDNETSAKNVKIGSSVENKTEYGVFTEMRWDFDPVLLTTGVRYDDYDLTNNTGKNISESMVNPSILGIWNINDNLSLNASWSQAIHSPKIHESLLLTLGNAKAHGFADDLVAGKAQTAEVGVEWQGDSGFVVGANAYDQRIKDYIHTIYTKERVGLQTNDGELRNKGYEANIGYRDDNIKAYLGFSHNEPELNGEYYGHALDVIPTGTKYNTSLSYKFDKPKLEIGAKQHFVSEYNYREKGDTTDRTAPKYFITDVFANWQPFANDQLSINTGINNISDKMYYNQSNFRTARFTPNDYSNWNPEKGREYRIGVNYKF